MEGISGEVRGEVMAGVREIVSGGLIGEMRAGVR